MTYQPPHQIPPEQALSSLVRSLHNGDFRRFFIEFPRLRFDGFYVAVITYLRRGESSQAWSTPTHLITFYRYLRFYPSGVVISLLSTDAPAAVVRSFNPLLRAKGLTIGRWKLRNDLVECWGLEDPNVSAASRRYSFRMELKLRSTARGKMNKLELLSLATENRMTEELEDVPTRPNKPFYFSKVRIYSHE